MFKQEEVKKLIQDSLDLLQSSQLEAKKNRINSLEEETKKADFWQRANAQEKMQLLAANKREIAKLEKIKNLIKNLKNKT